jgi:hypothetical protein
MPPVLATRKVSLDWATKKAALVSVTASMFPKLGCLLKGWVMLEVLRGAARPALPAIEQIHEKIFLLLLLLASRFVCVPNSLLL